MDIVPPEPSETRAEEERALALTEGYDPSLDLGPLEEAEEEGPDVISPTRETFAEAAQWAREQSGKAYGGVRVRTWTLLSTHSGRVIAAWPSSLLKGKLPADVILSWRWYPSFPPGGYISFDIEVTRGYHRNTGLALTTTFPFSMLTSEQATFEGVLTTLRKYAKTTVYKRVLSNLRKEAHFGDMKAFYDEFTRRLTPHVDPHELHGDVGPYDEARQRKLPPETFDANPHVANYETAKALETKLLELHYFDSVIARYGHIEVNKYFHPQNRDHWYPENFKEAKLEIAIGRDRRYNLPNIIGIETSVYGGYNEKAKAKHGGWSYGDQGVRKIFPASAVPVYWPGPTALAPSLDPALRVKISDLFAEAYELFVKALIPGVDPSELHTDVGPYDEAFHRPWEEKVAVRVEDWQAAEAWAKANFKRLGLHYDTQISAIAFNSSTDFWLDKNAEGFPKFAFPELNPELMTLTFNSGLGEDYRGDIYLRRISFDPGKGIAPVPIDWVASSHAPDPPVGLEEFIVERSESGEPLASFTERLRKFPGRAEKLPAFAEAYRGVYERLFPQVAPHELHTDVGAYDESITLDKRLNYWDWERLRPEDEVVLKHPNGQTYKWTILKANPSKEDIDKKLALIDRFYPQKGTWFLATREGNQGKIQLLNFTGTDNWYFPKSVEPHELHTDVGAYDESLIRALEAEEKPPRNWQPLTPEEINELKPGEEVLVNYYGHVSPAKWQRTQSLTGHPETYAVVIQAVDPELLTDPLWNPDVKETVRYYFLGDIGKEISTEPEELHTDVGAYDESTGDFLDYGEWYRLKPGDVIMHPRKRGKTTSFTIDFPYFNNHGDKCFQVISSKGDWQAFGFRANYWTQPSSPEPHELHTDVGPYDESAEEAERIDLTAVCANQQGYYRLAELLKDAGFTWVKVQKVEGINRPADLTLRANKETRDKAGFHYGMNFLLVPEGLHIRPTFYDGQRTMQFVSRSLVISRVPAELPYRIVTPRFSGDYSPHYDTDEAMPEFGKIYTEFLETITSSVASHEMHGDLAGYDESRLSESMTQQEWEALEVGDKIDFQVIGHYNPSYTGPLPPENKPAARFTVTKVYRSTLSPLVGKIGAILARDASGKEAQFGRSDLRHLTLATSVEPGELHTDIGPYDEAIQAGGPTIDLSHQLANLRSYENQLKEYFNEVELHFGRNQDTSFLVKQWTIDIGKGRKKQGPYSFVFQITITPESLIFGIGLRPGGTTLDYRNYPRDAVPEIFPRNMRIYPEMTRLSGEAYDKFLEILGTVEPSELHTDIGAYDESLLKEEIEEKRYYGIATGDGNSGVSTMYPDYIVLTDKPWDLADLAAYAAFKDEPAIQEWVGKNMEIDGDAEYGISVVFPESMEYQAEREAAQEEYERRREEAEAAGEEFEEEDPSEEFSENTSWFIIEIFPIPASEIGGYRCDVYDNSDHPDFLDPLYSSIEPHELHTDTGAYDEAVRKDRAIEEAMGLYRGPKFDPARWAELPKELGRLFGDQLWIKNPDGRKINGVTDAESFVSFTPILSNLLNELVHIIISTSTPSPAFSVHLYGDEMTTENVPTTLEEAVGWHDAYFVGGSDEQNRVMGRAAPGEVEDFLKMFRQDRDAPVLERFYAEVIERLFGSVAPHELHTDVGAYDEGLSREIKLLEDTGETTDLSDIAVEDLPELEQELKKAGFSTAYEAEFLHKRKSLRASHSEILQNSIKILADFALTPAQTHRFAGSTHSEVREGDLRYSLNIWKPDFSDGGDDSQKWPLKAIPLILPPPHKPFKLAKRDLPGVLAACTAAYQRYLAVLKPVEPHEIHTDVGTYDESLISRLKENIVIQDNNIDITGVTKEEALGYGEVLKGAGPEYSVSLDEEDPTDVSVRYNWEGKSGVYQLSLRLTLEIGSGQSTRYSGGHTRAYLSIQMARSDPRTRPGYASAPASYVPHWKRKKLDKGQAFPLWTGVRRIELEPHTAAGKFCGKFRPLFAKAFAEIYDCLGKHQVAPEELHTDVGAYDEARLIEAGSKIGPAWINSHPGKSRYDFEGIDYDALAKRLDALEEVELQAYQFYIGFRVPPIIVRWGQPTQFTFGTKGEHLNVRIGRHKSDHDVTVQWYPSFESWPQSLGKSPSIHEFPNFEELLAPGLKIPEEFFREAWEKIYHVVAGGVEPSELHTDIGAYDESVVSTDYPSIDLSELSPADWMVALKEWKEAGHNSNSYKETEMLWFEYHAPEISLVFVLSANQLNLELHVGSQVKVEGVSINRVPADGEAAWKVLMERFMDEKSRAFYASFKEAFREGYEKWLRLFKSVEPHELHTDIGTYDEAVAVPGGVDLSGYSIEELRRIGNNFAAKGPRYTFSQDSNIDTKAYGKAQHWVKFEARPVSTLWGVVEVVVYETETPSYPKAGVLIRVVAGVRNSESEVFPSHSVPPTLPDFLIPDHAGIGTAEFEAAYQEILSAFHSVEPSELHTDVGAYDEALMRRLKEAREVKVDSDRVEEAVRWAKGRWPTFVHDTGGRGRRTIYFFFSAPQDIGQTLKTKPSASVKFQFARLPNQEEHLVSMIVNYEIPGSKPKPYGYGLEIGIIDIVEDYPIPFTWEELEKEILHKYGQKEGKFIYKFRRLKFFPAIREAFEGFVERIFAPVAPHELHTDVGAYDESRIQEAVIKTSYTVVTPESAEEGDFAEAGWLDEQGHDCEPDEIDREQGLDRVDLAVQFLKNEGAVHPLSEDTYEGSPYTTDYETGEETTTTFHLSGFEESELENIRLLMRGEKRLPPSVRPEELHTDTGAYDESLLQENAFSGTVYHGGTWPRKKIPIVLYTSTNPDIAAKFADFYEGSVHRLTVSLTRAATEAEVLRVATNIGMNTEVSSSDGLFDNNVHPPGEVYLLKQRLERAGYDGAIFDAKEAYGVEGAVVVIFEPQKLHTDTGVYDESVFPKTMAAFMDLSHITDDSLTKIQETLCPSPMNNFGGWQGTEYYCHRETGSLLICYSRSLKPQGTNFRAVIKFDLSNKTYTPSVTYTGKSKNTVALYPPRKIPLSYFNTETPKLTPFKGENASNWPEVKEGYLQFYQDIIDALISVEPHELHTDIGAYDESRN